MFFETYAPRFRSLTGSMQSQRYGTIWKLHGPRSGARGEETEIVLLIQTALEQEFRAVASVLERSDEDRSRRGDSAQTLLYGQIAQRACCVVRTGVGLKLAERVLSKTLEHIERPQLVLSLGLAGALSPKSGVGQRRLIASVQRSDRREPCPLLAALDLLAPKYRHSMSAVPLVSVDLPVLTRQAKQQLHRTSQAALCDMETHAVARVAVAHGVPWLGARVVSDAFSETLAPWFLELPQLIELRAWGGLARQLATHPQDLPRLLRLAVRMRSLERQLAQFTVELIRNVLRP
jgi:nucleoside phosphorylase